MQTATNINVQNIIHQAVTQNGYSNLATVAVTDKTGHENIIERPFRITRLPGSTNKPALAVKFGGTISIIKLGAPCRIQTEYGSLNNSEAPPLLSMAGLAIARSFNISSANDKESAPAFQKLPSVTCIKDQVIRTEELSTGKLKTWIIHNKANDPENGAINRGTKLAQFLLNAEVGSIIRKPIDGEPMGEAIRILG